MRENGRLGSNGYVCILVVWQGCGKKSDEATGASVHTEEEEIVVHVVP
jgi:hypothetical protein